jgi:hypothetical protein
LAATPGLGCAGGSTTITLVSAGETELPSSSIRE